jgi:outer membrane protein
MSNSWKAAALAAGIAAILAAPAARADDDPFMIRLRAVYLDFAQKSDAIPSLGVPSDAITVNKKWIPDLDLEYFFTPNWSSELVLTYPQSQTVSVNGLGPIGTFKHLPPTLTVKYNFLPDSVFRPYVGVGVNLTFISNVNLAVPGVGPLDLDSTSVGVAGQVGADFKVADHWFVNVDAKWVQLGSDVKFDGSKISTVHLNPWLLGVGIGYRFGGPAPAPMPVSAPAPAPTPPPAPAPKVLPPPPPPPPAAPPPPRRVTFSADALFTFNSAVVRPEGKSALDKFASELRATTYEHVHVIGYTDRIGSDAYNLWLSKQRADAVRGYLVDTAGVDAGKVEAEGRGKADPVTKPGQCGAKQSPTTIACLQPDRRVEIEVSGTQR